MNTLLTVHLAYIQTGRHGMEKLVAVFEDLDEAKEKLRKHYGVPVEGWTEREGECDRTLYFTSRKSEFRLHPVPLNTFLYRI